MEQATYSIPAGNLPGLEKKIAKLSARGLKTGTGFISVIEIGKKVKRNDDGTVDVTCEIVIEGEAPHYEGWTFIAKLDHNTDETGASNIIYVMPKQNLPERFRHNPANCEHCGWVRKRRDTYVLQNEDGEYKQVGRTCVKDFFDGQDPEKVAKAAEALVKAAKAAREFQNAQMNDHRYISVNHYLPFVAAEIETNGWVSGKDAYYNRQMSTARLALDEMFRPYKEHPSQANRDIAEKAIEWAQKVDVSKSDFNFNISQVANNGYVDQKTVGLTASIIRCYHNAEKTAAARTFELDNSEHVGELKERIERKVEIVTNISMEGNYGPYSLIRMVDGDNLLVTFASGNFNPDKGEKVTIRGTVAKHDVYNNVNQTILKRVMEVK